MFMLVSLVNRGKWLRRQAGKLQRSKQRGQDLCWKVHDRAHSLRSLWLNYVTETFLLVSCSGTTHTNCVLCTVKAKKANKNMEQRTLFGFITIYLVYWIIWDWGIARSLVKRTMPLHFILVRIIFGLIVKIVLLLGQRKSSHEWLDKTGKIMCMTCPPIKCAIVNPA